MFEKGVGGLMFAKVGGGVVGSPNVCSANIDPVPPHSARCYLRKH